MASCCLAAALLATACESTASPPPPASLTATAVSRPTPTPAPPAGTPVPDRRGRYPAPSATPAPDEPRVGTIALPVGPRRLGVAPLAILGWVRVERGIPLDMSGFVIEKRVDAALGPGRSYLALFGRSPDARGNAAGMPAPWRYALYGPERDGARPLLAAERVDAPGSMDLAELRVVHAAGVPMLLKVVWLSGTAGIHGVSLVAEVRGVPSRVMHLGVAGGDPISEVGGDIALRNFDKYGNPGCLPPGSWTSIFRWDADGFALRGREYHAASAAAVLMKRGRTDLVAPDREEAADAARPAVEAGVSAPVVLGAASDYDPALESLERRLLCGRLTLAQLRTAVVVEIGANGYSTFTVAVVRDETTLEPVLVPGGAALFAPPP